MILDGVSNPLLGDYGWFCGNSGYDVQPVAQKLPNGFGLYDMHGNLWEWTADWYNYSYSIASVDPWNASVSSTRVIRGGGSGNHHNTLRASYRSWDIPSNNNYAYYGFRLVLRAP